MKIDTISFGWSDLYHPQIFFIGTFLLSFLLGYPAARLLVRFNVVDEPNARSSHTRATVRGGGVGILAALILAAIPLIRLQGGHTLGIVLLGVLALAAISFRDDLKSVSAPVRFGVHAAVALAALAAIGWPKEAFSYQRTGLFLPQWMMLSLLFLWITGHTNAFNFMDGINGIAGSQAFWVASGLGLLGSQLRGGFDHPAILFCFAVGGAAAGFLPHNFPKARMFMGDVGSASLGCLLAVLAVWLANDLGWDLVVPAFLLCANFVLDTSITLVRRVLRGEKWHAPHREHFYQRLNRAGKSHSFVTGLTMGLQFVVLCLALFYLRSSTIPRVLIVAGVCALWTAFFIYSELKFSRGPAVRVKA